LALSIGTAEPVLATANAKQSPMTIAANNPDHLQHVKRP
jgi:hypothetical protein